MKARSGSSGEDITRMIREEFSRSEDAEVRKHYSTNSSVADEADEIYRAARDRRGY
ncbi:hypothetical protein GCM10009737_10060 [Nocardioides lentus]|uniref:Uncharacterized protein n=1 Tax=Nocardioides lentus TaxID=338077 RepID=A0ABP5ACZ1_9ACTN